MRCFSRHITVIQLRVKGFTWNEPDITVVFTTWHPVKTATGELARFSFHVKQKVGSIKFRAGRNRTRLDRISLMDVFT